jgi:hypothetical protein
MNQSCALCAGRRDALKRGLNAGIGIAIVAIAGRAVSQTQIVKLSKDAVKYTDAGNLPGKDCDDCSQYLPGNSAKEPAGCKLVEGVINPHGHCIAFSPKG